MRRRRKLIVKRKRLEYVSVKEKIWIDKINEEVKGLTSSSKQQKYPPERTKIKEETRLEWTKIKLKSALEWDDFMLQAQFKSFMYVDRSLRGDQRRTSLLMI